MLLYTVSLIIVPRVPSDFIVEDWYLEAKGQQDCG